MKRHISKEDIRIFMESPIIPMKYKCILTLIDKCAFRPSEAVNMNIDRIDFARRLYFIPLSKAKRANEPKYLFKDIDSIFLPYIISEWPRIKACGGYLFPADRRPGRKLTRRGFFVMFWKYRKRLGLDKEIIGRDSIGRKLYSKTAHAARRKCATEYRNLILRTTGICKSENIKILGNWTSDAYNRYLENTSETVQDNGRYLEALKQAGR